MSIGAKGQEQVINIKFVHGGEELKPIGTLLISTKTEAIPNDKRTDLTYGLSLKTDKRTLELIKQFIDKTDYLFKDNSKLQGTNEYFAIKYSDGLKLFLRGEKINAFFTSLRKFLYAKHADNAVCDILANY